MAEGSPGSIIGRNVRAVREAQLISRTHLAERSGVSVAGIDHLERGLSARPRRRTIEKLAEALDVPVTHLMSEEPLRPLGPALPLQEKLFNNGVEEEWRAKLAEVEDFVHGYAFGRADYWEQELERGRAKEYATADAAYNLAVLATNDFSSIQDWLLSHGAGRSLWEAMDKGIGVEFADEFEALIDALIERTIQTQHKLFANAERLAETEAKRNVFAAKRLQAEADRTTSVGRRSA